ncbi:FxLYD domain-containing protein [Halobacteria archaeon AArc-dxtr1]|nr:FxLYD domain-containing protein [Halobacteria archaeon AArc-dxtr1]
MDDHSSTRRQLLAASVTGTGLALLAGCTGDDDGDDDGNDDSNDDSGETDSDGTELDPQEILTDSERESTRDGLEILEHEFYSNMLGADTGVEGVVANNTGEELRRVEVSVVFYNAEGQRLRTDATSTTDLPDGEEWLFDVTFFGETSEANEVEEYTIGVTDGSF